MKPKKNVTPASNAASPQANGAAGPDAVMKDSLANIIALAETIRADLQAGAKPPTQAHELLEEAAAALNTLQQALPQADLSPADSLLDHLTTATVALEVLQRTLVQAEGTTGKGRRRLPKEL